MSDLKKDVDNLLREVVGDYKNDRDSKRNLNEEKRNIYVLKRGFLQQFLDDFRAIMIYDQSSQRVSKSVIKTENTNLTMP